MLSNHNKPVGDTAERGNDELKYCYLTKSNQKV